MRGILNSNHEEYIICDLEENANMKPTRKMENAKLRDG